MNDHKPLCAESLSQPYIAKIVCTAPVCANFLLLQQIHAACNMCRNQLVQRGCLFWLTILETAVQDGKVKLLTSWPGIQQYKKEGQGEQGIVVPQSHLRVSSYDFKTSL